VAEDKLGYKWGRWVNKITLSDDADYRGYWEQAGYSNDADISP
jgi:DMSO/TMAO reductase YedYZ molybdopterin-dependent catalytic subunit